MVRCRHSNDGRLQERKRAEVAEVPPTKHEDKAVVAKPLGAGKVETAGKTAVVATDASAASEAWLSKRGWGGPWVSTAKKRQLVEALQEAAPSRGWLSKRGLAGQV